MKESKKKKFKKKYPAMKRIVRNTYWPEEYCNFWRRNNCIFEIKGIIKWR
jgi:hypothetical protein